MGEDKWISSLEGISTVPYNLPGLLDGVRAGETVFHVEGCKDVDTARALGLVATTTGGSETWRPEYRTFYTGADVVIPPDNDKAGRAYADTVASSLQGVARSVKVAELPVPVGGDLTDYMESGGTLEALLAIVEAAPEWTPPADVSDVSDVFSGRESSNTVPEFPVDALPSKVARYVREAAASLSCPPDIVAIPAIGALSGVIGRTREVRIKRGWPVSASLYMVVVAGAGEAKSPAQSAATYPVQKLQGMLRNTYAEEKKVYENEVRQHTVDKKQAAKDGKPEPEPPAKPIMRRVLVDDITIEALATRLEENPRGFLSAQDELTGFLRGMDQYKSGGKGNTRQSYLKIWSNGTITVDRKGADEPVIVPHPFVTLQGGIQPPVLHEIADGRDDGFLDRFLFAYPEVSRGGYSEDEISAKAEFDYETLVTQLWNQQGFDPEGTGSLEPRRLEMDREAKTLFVEAANALATEKRTPGFPASLTGPWSKMDTQLAKLALIVACARIAEDRGAPELVTGDDMRNALRLLEYFKATTRKVYGAIFEANPDEILAADVSTFLTKRAYVYQGTISSLMDEMEMEGLEDGLPSGKDPAKSMGRALRRISKASPVLHYESRPMGDRRMITLRLEKTSETSETSVKDDFDREPDAPDTPEDAPEDWQAEAMRRDREAEEAFDGVDV